MRNAGGTRDKVTTVCAPTPATTHYVPGARRREERKRGRKGEREPHFQSSIRPDKNGQTHHRATRSEGVVITVYWPCGYDLLPSFPAKVATHIRRAKQKFSLCLRSNFFFSNLGHFFSLFNPVFSFFSFQNYEFFWNPTKIDVFTMFFPLELFSLHKNFFFLRKW